MHAVAGAAGEQDVPGLERLKHVGNRASVMGLALGQREADRVAFGIDKRMDPGGRTARGNPFYEYVTQAKVDRP
jgi:hypothetical protein